jgi:hypothetical protein
MVRSKKDLIVNRWIELVGVEESEVWWESESVGLDGTPFCL